MKGRKPATPRILEFNKVLFSSSKGKKRTIAWLQLAVLFLVVCNSYFWKICNWYFKNYGPLEAILTFIVGWQILQTTLFVRREKKIKEKGKTKRKKTKKS